MANTRIPDSCEAWLAQWIGRTDQRLHNIEKALKQLAHNNPRGRITAKWLLEKVAIPVLLVAITYFVARGGK